MMSVGVVSDNAMGVALLTSQGTSDVIRCHNAMGVVQMTSEDE